MLHILMSQIKRDKKSVISMFSVLGSPLHTRALYLALRVFN